MALGLVVCSVVAYFAESCAVHRRLMCQMHQSCNVSPGNLGNEASDLGSLDIVAIGIHLPF